jgi:hypothetical protein
VLLTFFGGLALFSVTGAYIIASISVPKNSPMARMYRTEADLASLVTAVRTYRQDLGEYPPAGPEGLRMATDYLSRIGNYLPAGPPLDGWDQAFVYVPSGAYAEAGSMALEKGGVYFAPDSFQLYSVGMDGDPGLHDPYKQRDNITSWDSAKDWRSLYRERHRKYFTEEGRRQ